MIFQALEKYSLIASNGWWAHRNGGYPYVCSSIGISSIDILESFCTDQPSCSGFAYKDGTTYAYLIVSDSTCPNGFNYVSAYRKPAETKHDLIAEHQIGYVCYGKNIGKSVLKFEKCV